MSKKILVAYFSCSGVTKKVAENLAAAVNGDIFEIKPTVPYTNADLDWMNKKSRSSVEMKDLSSRPEFIKEDIDMAQYDAVFVGFPVWWYVAPTIINAFLESYDFAEKTIIPFCTSGGSGLGRTVEHLQPSAHGLAKFDKGKLLNGNPSREDLKKWVDSLEL